MRRKYVSLKTFLLAIAMSAALAACNSIVSGASTPPARSQPPGACMNATASNSAAWLGTGMAGEAPRVVPVTTLPPGVTLGQVQVVVESNSYSPESTIFAWAGNGLSQCIYATDHHSDCSLVELERQVNGGWQPQANCQPSAPVQILALAPMQADFVRLTPTPTGAQQGVWQTGTYRMAFRYRLDRGGTGPQTEVDSETFIVA